MHSLYSVGELSTWAESVLQSFEQSIGQALHRCPDVAALKNQATTTVTPIVLIENGFGSQKWIESIRVSGFRGLLIWFGKTFSKDEYAFALQNRVYSVIEGISPGDTRMAESIARAEVIANSENDMQHLLRTLKTVILQRSEADQGAEILDELKTVVAKLDKCSHANELVGAAPVVGVSDSRLPLHQSAELTDALLTVADLERTGTLQIYSKTLQRNGSVHFIQGKIVKATAGAVVGLKAVYRMFLWPEVSFQFARQEATDVVVDEQIPMSVREVCVHGEKLRREFHEIRANIPPGNIHLELQANALNATSRLESDLFSTLASIVEFGKVAQVLDYNDLPDVNLYKALIALRRKQLIRVLPNK